MPTKKTPAKKPDSKKPDDEDTEGQEGAEGEGSDDDGDDDQDQNQRINAIVTSRVKREMKAVNSQLQAMMQKLESMSAPKKEETDDEGDEGDEGEGKKAEAKQDLKSQRILARLQKELAEEKDARKKAELAQKEEQAKAARQEMVSAFDAALTEHGVTDPKLRRAALMSLEADGVMVREEDTGKVKFKGTDKYGMEVLYDPKAGVKQWVTTEGKSFIPAVDAGGSGTGGARQGIGNTSLSKGEFNKLSDQQKAAINLERACSGQPPLE
jgi:hypothetical protein